MPPFLESVVSVRPWPSEGLHRDLHASQSEALADNTLFEETAGAVRVSPKSVSRRVTFFKSFIESGQGHIFETVNLDVRTMVSPIL